jgi:hypothetical protein
VLSAVFKEVAEKLLITPRNCTGNGNSNIFTAEERQ